MKPTNLCDKDCIIETCQIMIQFCSLRATSTIKTGRVVTPPAPQAQAQPQHCAIRKLPVTMA